MTKTFLVSDTHFGHAGVCRFTRDDGSPLRPWDDPTEMNIDMIERWNSVVNHDDKVYHLGDFCLNPKAMWVSHKLNGRKVLIKGNHDTFKLSYYSAFDDIRAYHVLDNILLSHIPVHPSQKGRYAANVHGHTHYRVVEDQWGNPDPWYVCMCVEHWDYTPVDWELIRERVHGEH